MKLRVGDLVTTSALTDNLDGVTIYSEIPKSWSKVPFNREIGLLKNGLTATVLAVYRCDALCVYIVGEGFMGWAVSAYLERIICGRR